MAADDEGIIRCICSYNDDDGFTIQCEKCMVWQHAACVGIRKDNVPEEYFCEDCDPRPLDIQLAKEIQRRRRMKKKKPGSSTNAAQPKTGSGNVKASPSRRRKEKSVQPLDRQRSLSKELLSDTASNQGDYNEDSDDDFFDLAEDYIPVAKCIIQDDRIRSLFASLLQSERQSSTPAVDSAAGVEESVADSPVEKQSIEGQSLPSSTETTAAAVMSEDDSPNQSGGDDAEMQPAVQVSLSSSATQSAGEDAEQTGAESVEQKLPVESTKLPEENTIKHDAIPEPSAADDDVEMKPPNDDGDSTESIAEPTKEDGTGDVAVEETEPAEIKNDPVPMLDSIDIRIISTKNEPQIILTAIQTVTESRSSIKTALVAEVPIDKDQLITECRGELIYNDNGELNEMLSERFIFAHPSLPILMDARRFGNEARFIRYSCQPNAKLCSYRSYDYSDSVIHLGVFAIRKIAPGDEIVLSYPIENPPDGSRIALDCACAEYDYCLFNPNHSESKVEKPQLQQLPAPLPLPPLQQQQQSKPPKPPAVTTARPSKPAMEEPPKSTEQSILESELFNKPEKLLTREERKIRDELLRFAKMERENEARKKRLSGPVSSSNPRQTAPRQQKPAGSQRRKEPSSARPGNESPYSAGRMAFADTDSSGSSGSDSDASESGEEIASDQEAIASPTTQSPTVMRQSNHNLTLSPEKSAAPPPVFVKKMWLRMYEANLSETSSTAVTLESVVASADNSIGNEQERENASPTVEEQPEESRSSTPGKMDLEKSISAESLQLSTAEEAKESIAAAMETQPESGGKTETDAAVITGKKRNAPEDIEPPNNNETQTTRISLKDYKKKRKIQQETKDSTGDSAPTSPMNSPTATAMETELATVDSTVIPSATATETARVALEGKSEVPLRQTSPTRLPSTTTTKSPRSPVKQREAESHDSKFHRRSSGESYHGRKEFPAPANPSFPPPGGRTYPSSFPEKSDYPPVTMANKDYPPSTARDPAGYGGRDYNSRLMTGNSAPVREQPPPHHFDGRRDNHHRYPPHENARQSYYPGGRGGAAAYRGGPGGNRGGRY